MPQSAKETDNLVPDPSFRQFLKATPWVVAGLSLFPFELACASKPVTKETEDEEWDQSIIESKARAMMNDDRFPNMAHAGEILLKNQQGGQPSLSLECPIFKDEKIHVRTLTKITSPYKDDDPQTPPPAKALISYEKPIITTVLKAKTGASTRETRSESYLALRQIQIAKDVAEGKSDMVIQLFLAKEIYNAHAFQLVSSEVAKKIFQNYKMPESEEEKRALQVYAVKEKTQDGVTAIEIADMLAHFYIIPDYMKAVDLGLVAEEDKKTILSFFDAFATVSKQENLLVKDEQGNYQWNDKWTGNQLSLTDIWLVLAHEYIKVRHKKAQDLQDAMAKVLASYQTKESTLSL